MSSHTSDSEDEDFVPKEESDGDEPSSGDDDDDEAGQPTATTGTVKMEEQQRQLRLKEEAKKRLEQLNKYVDKEQTATQLQNTSIAKPDNVTPESSIPDNSKAEKTAEITRVSSPSKAVAPNPSTQSNGAQRKPLPKKRKSPLDSLLAPKPAKASTLKASHSEWKSFVAKEGIEDELRHHNKDGYIQKLKFLQRTDDAKEKEVNALRSAGRSRRGI